MIDSLHATKVFLQSLMEELGREIAAAGALDTAVNWSIPSDVSEPLPEDLIWWIVSCGGGTADTLAVGGRVEDWKAIGFPGDVGNTIEMASGRLQGCLEKTVEKQLSRSGPLEGALGSAPAPDNNGTRAIVKIETPGSEAALFYCCFSSALEHALAEKHAAGSDNCAMKTHPSPLSEISVEGSPVSLNLLMDVEVPVRVSFGKTRIRMGELLAVNPGAVIELDQTLGDPVEVLVDRRLIARGEVVAVDGNYGVRILEIISRVS